ncbi:MAG: DUF3817 domain-containing protein [Myxococcales bacterium]|jgi:integral membrane protein|nr:DUF3817 domain-containing protein [Myxococcales bacterium]
MLQTPLGRFRALALLEGTSFLLLLGIAMPLKYFAGMPLAVKLVGWAHGVLFVGFLAAIPSGLTAAGWPWRKAGTLVLASLVPFGPFVLDRALRDAELQQRRG